MRDIDIEPRHASDDDPLVLLHGLGMSARVWDDVRPWLARHHEVVPLTLPGHRGAAAPARRPVTVADLVDGVERELDARGLDRPDIAGNSLGGWIAIELARRGRARTVCALSPAGSWTAGTAEQTAGVRKIRRLIRAARLGRRLPLMRSAAVRRLALHDVAEHGERLTPAQAIAGGEDLLGCIVADDILSTGEQIEPLDPLPCPVMLAWAGADAVLPVEVNGAIARARLPQARFVVLPGLGHVPMIDDPRRVAGAILRTTAASRRRSTAAWPTVEAYVSPAGGPWWS
jgi:pimeloyl-ACP methyl ester carboxylesterase